MTAFAESLLSYKRRGESRNQFVERAGFDNSTLTRLMNGTRSPSPDMIDRIVENLGLGEKDRSLLIATAFGMKRTELPPGMRQVAVTLSDPGVPQNVREILMSFMTEFGELCAVLQQQLTNGGEAWSSEAEPSS
jgi:transcriptional regulator with XRE-family HTH domain